MMVDEYGVCLSMMVDEYGVCLSMMVDEYEGWFKYGG
jgi:hypothetical protein